jgi:hypothetical protein
MLVDAPLLLPNIPPSIDEFGDSALYVGRSGADGLLESVPVNGPPGWCAPSRDVLGDTAKCRIP